MATQIGQMAMSFTLNLNPGIGGSKCEMKYKMKMQNHRFKLFGSKSSVFSGPILFAIGLLLIGLFSGCEKEELTFYSGSGLRPIYVTGDAFYLIENQPPQPIVQSGSIFLKDTFLFIVDLGKGIHVFGVDDPAHPVALTFIRIPAINGFTLSGNTLYADSWSDLVTIDWSDLYHVVVLDRKTGVFEPILYPPQYSGIFECVNPDRGAVVGWEPASLEKVRCRANQ